jgi:head-tail adaptor
VATEDEVGNLIEQDRTEVATVWAMVLPYAAKISDGYAEKVDEVTYRVVIRYREDIQVTDVLQWRGKTLLMSVPPCALNGGRKYLVMEAKELVEDG